MPKCTRQGASLHCTNYVQGFTSHTLFSRITQDIHRVKGEVPLSKVIKEEVIKGGQARLQTVDIKCMNQSLGRGEESRVGEGQENLCNCYAGFG